MLIFRGLSVILGLQDCEKSKHVGSNFSFVNDSMILFILTFSELSLLTHKNEYIILCDHYVVGK